MNHYTHTNYCSECGGELRRTETSTHKGREYPVPGDHCDVCGAHWMTSSEIDRLSDAVEADKIERQTKFRAMTERMGPGPEPCLHCGAALLAGMCCEGMRADIIAGQTVAQKAERNIRREAKRQRKLARRAARRSIGT